MKPFKIIPQFLQQIERGETFAYRGHWNIAHPPIPSIGRYPLPESSLVKKREQEAITNFKKRSFHLQQRTPGPDIEWLALMQHHGCSTRLLDFTTNPLIALYFACQSNDQANDRTDGVVFTATFNRIETEPTNEQIFNETGNFAYFPPHVTSRIIGQSGCFIFFGNPSAPPDEKELRPICIPAGSKYPARSELATLGITGATLFPGIDGVCRDINGQLIERLIEDWDP